MEMILAVIVCSVVTLALSGIQGYLNVSEQMDKEAKRKRAAANLNKKS